MADAICELIVTEAVDAITAATAVRVYRSRDAALAVGQYPAVVIVPVQDDPEETTGTVCYIDWQMLLAADVIVGEGMDTAAHPIRAQIHAAMMDSSTVFAVPGVTDIEPSLVQYQLNNRVADVAHVRCPFKIRYRTRHDDLTVAAP
jgi:hypothetical protein